jgi:hypothetical protein
MRRPLLLLIPLVAALFACSDHDAKSDLAVENQKLNTGDVNVAVMPDGFPNVAHKCVDFSGVQVGMWTTTDRTLILVYNDHACAGSNIEQPQEVVNAVPRSVVNSGG